MANLKSLKLNNNKLSGSMSDMFGKLSKITEMDLSSNSLSGSLPQSFKSLSSLSKLHVQNNQFTGSINVLADLPLDDLNVKDNQFTGWIPNELKGIDSLETGGNSWSTGTAPPPPPGQKHKPHPRHSTKDSKKSAMRVATIVGIVLGVLVLLCVLCVIIALFSRRRSKPRSSHFLEEDRFSQRQHFTPISSQELSKDMRADFQDTEKQLQTSSSMGLKRPPSESRKSFNEKEITNLQPLDIKRSSSTRLAYYPLADLQTATANFATSHLLGEGSIGRVYRAKCSDGRVLAVKKISSSFFQDGQPTEFKEIVYNMSKLHHPNIAETLGYCSEQGQKMLIYEYFRNGSLHNFLHLSDDFSKPLTWNTRVRIALGTARAIEYLHEVCSPSCLHRNIKTSNIFLDVDLNPRLCECGLAMFHEQAKQNLDTGYTAPECTKPSAYTVKSEIYSFGVVMLELLTGQKPFNSSKPRSEECLVQWASPQLHDIDALENMADPALRGLYPPKSLSRFANVAALCVQPEPEFRPRMSEVVDSLVRLVQRSNLGQREDLSASRRTDDGY